MSRKIKGEQKKFLGETLNQYDKALNEGITQLNKKNREQNHKISSLVNSFDNEYLEKDVEGNMTTLENSKDGMVIINEIQGNTEVNYCKDGEKELILNGDIDTQGESFVTITEGVDGGLVDVSLEGNTEINLSNTKDPVLVTREFDDINCNVGKLQYTIDDVTTINDEPGKVDIDRIVGDTMVNHAVNGSEELILNAHINESGDNNITLNGVTSDGGLVDVALEGNTLVNVSKTKDSTALPLDEELTYLYANTQYTIQFVADKAITVDITLGGTELLAQSIVAGLNKITITTPSELVDNKLVISGVGANISEVVVTDTNRYFKYFEGMKSVGECEDLEVVSCNSDSTQSNTQTLIHEPLRAVGGIKDKYVLIDGKWYIERNCGVRAYQEGDIDNYITDMINTVYPLSTPTYEPIDYNPFTVYSNTTHISNNSTIPCNMIIKNHGYNMVALKENTSYTLYVDNKNNTSVTYRLGDYVEINSLSKFTFTTPSTLTDKTLRIDGKGAKVNDLMLIEGTPINDSIGYFDGLKSSYECEQVTDESDENYNKYKVDIKVVGKNLFDKNKFINAELCTFNGIECVKVQDTNKYFKYYDNFKYNTQYTLTLKVYREEGFIDRFFDVIIEYTDGTKSNLGFKHSTIKTITTAQNKTINYIHGEWKFGGNIYIDLSVAQIEEGNTATEYEPYFESKQTIYLNSPLLKGDEIVWKDNKIQHYHKMGSVVLDGSDDEGWRIYQLNTKVNQFLIDINGKSTPLLCDKFNNNLIVNNENEQIRIWADKSIELNILKSKLQTQDISGFKQWLQQNPVTIVYELATPYYEEISDYPLKLNVIANSSLSTESTIQVTNISFNVYEETLPYLYPNTKYYITFNADVDRNNIIINLGGNHVVLDCKVGFNKVEITTPSDTTNLLTFSGTGVNIDHVKVTQQNIDEYFEGMKSVGECENNTLEIICKNNDNSKSNIQTLTHEPLRAVGDIKDKYVLIDGKWYIERNCGEVVLDGSETWSVAGGGGHDTRNTFEIALPNVILIKYNEATPAISPNYKNIMTRQIPEEDNVFRVSANNQNYGYFLFTPSTSIIPYRDGQAWKTWLSNNPITVIYPLATPTYEPIDYNPFTVYSDITHITANSLIPTNVVVKNHGYNCLLKPSTKYTIALNKPNGTISAKLGGSAKVDSTNNVFTITTPSTLNDNVLRLSGSGNVKDIMILEGDKTINTPSYFEGIESAFEQEYDAEKGKYRVTARVEGNGKESSIIFYINEPLRGTGTAKDKVFIQDGKVVVERNCSSSITFDGSADEGWITVNNSYAKLLLSPKPKLNSSNRCENCMCDTLRIIDNLSLGNGILVNDAVRIKTNFISNDEQARAWFAKNPVTVVYQLAEPVYEEADCDLSKLVLENYENSSLIFESNIPVSANIRYSGEVPVVTQAKTLSSKVDNTTLDINENIIPYMCDIDYRIVELQLMNGDTQGEGIELLGIGDIEILGNENVLFNNREDKKYNYSYDMLKRDILSQRYSKEEYQYRLDRYLLANKISDEEYKELEGLLNNGE